LQKCHGNPFFLPEKGLFLPLFPEFSIFPAKLPKLKILFFLLLFRSFPLISHFFELLFEIPQFFFVPLQQSFSALAALLRQSQRILEFHHPPLLLKLLGKRGKAFEAFPKSLFFRGEKFHSCAAPPEKFPNLPTLLLDLKVLSRTALIVLLFLGKALLEIP